MTASPPADQTTPLRDRIAEALMRWAEGNNSPQYAAMRRPETVRANAYSRADAVLAVLPATVARAAVLREAADHLDNSERLRDLTDDHMLDINAAANELRRVADETAATETQAEACPPGCVACATDESHDPAPAANCSCGVLRTGPGRHLPECPNGTAAGARQDGEQP